MSAAVKAAYADAAWLVNTVAAASADDPAVAGYVEGMDRDRARSAALVLTGLLVGLAEAYATATGLPVAEQLQIIQDEMVRDSREHGT